MPNVNDNERQLLCRAILWSTQTQCTLQHSPTFSTLSEKKITKVTVPEGNIYDNKQSIRKIMYMYMRISNIQEGKEKNFVTLLPSHDLVDRGQNKPNIF